MRNTCMNPKRWLAAGILSLLAGSVWAQQMAPVNPAFARWQRERAAKKAASTQSATPTKKSARSAATRGATGTEEEDFGFVPTVLDMGYLSNLNDNLTQGVGDELPSAFDLREESLLTPVRNQGASGNCWAFAALGSLESWILKSEGLALDLSENNLVNLHGWSPGFGAGGNAQMASGYHLRWAGPVAESEDPYPNPGKSVPGTPLRHVQRIRWIPGKTAYLDNDGIKSALMAWGALQADYYHAGSYYQSGKASYCFQPGTTSRLSNHTVDLVGWDDNYSRKNFKPEAPGDGAYIVRNSWGSGWGDGGYFHVSYYDGSLAWGTLYSFSSAEPIDNYDGVYQHDPLGMVGSIGYNGPTAWGANLFTATNASKVAAAGFYAMTPRTTYTLYVYTGCTASSPRSGTLAAQQSGTIDLAGYATVPLDSPVSVSAGQRFSVVLELATPGYSYPLAVEYAVAGYSPAATAHAGESFLSANGNKWDDFTKRVASSANFCCKAYVKSAAVTKTLSGIAIAGANTVKAGSSASFACTATYSDGSSKAVSPQWSISEGNAFATVTPEGVVTANAVDEQQTASLRAVYSEDGIEVSATWRFLVTVAAPEAPTGLVATEGTEESCVRLSWNASAGASSYAVYRGTKESASKAAYLGTVTVPRYADTAAVPGVDYRYFVKAKNDSGSSAFSDGAWGWRALAAPLNLVASDGLEDLVKVSWNQSEGASFYRVWRAEGVDGEPEPVSPWQTACQYEDTTAEAGTGYMYYATAALDADGTRESTFGVPDEGFRTGPVVLTALAIEGPVSLVSGGKGTYTCTAIYSDGNRKPIAADWSLEGGTLAIENRNAVAEAPVTGEAASMTLHAEYTDGKTCTGSLCITVTPVVPAAPETFELVEAGENGIALRWSTVADATSYQLWRASADEPSAVIASTTATETTDKTAVPGVTYAYRVGSVNAAGAGEPGETGVTATRPIAPPTGVGASYETYTDKVLATWNACEGAVCYRVWRAESLEGEKTALGGWQEALSFEDATAVAGTVYYYFVQAAADDAGTAASAFGGPAVGMRKMVPMPVALSIQGPERVAAGSTATYTAKVRYDNDASETVVPEWWIAEGGEGVSIGADGILAVGELDTDRTLVLAARFTDGATVEATLEVALVAPLVKAATITALSVKPRWPWNGLVDVDYTLATSPSGTVAKISLSGYDLDHRTSLAATTLSGDGARGATVEAGEHRITWNVGADHPGFHASQVRVSLNAVPSEPVDPVSSDVLLHRWSFNGNLKDSVGGRDAVHSGNSSYSWSNAGKAVSLPGGRYGTSALFLGKDVVPSDGTPVTIEIWGTQRKAQDQSRVFELTSRLGNGFFSDFIEMSWSRDGSVDGHEIIVWESDPNNWSDWTAGSPCSKWWTTNALSPFEIGTEYHISMVIEPDKDGAGNTYVRFAKRDAATGEILAQKNGYASGGWTPVRLAGREMWLGRASFTPGNDAAADYDEVRIWNAALTDEQLADNARRGPDNLPGGAGGDDPGGDDPGDDSDPGEDDEPPSKLSDGLVAYWPFDGDAKDASGNGNHGTVNGATLTADRNGNADGAYSFDGNDRIVVADSESLRSPTNAISIAVWMKLTTMYDACLVCKGENKRQYGFYFSAQGDKCVINDRLGETGFDAMCDLSPGLETGVWTHFVAVWDGKICKAYANGIQVGEDAAEGMFAANGVSLYIGVDYPEADEYYKGTMDDLAIWNRALTAEEVARLHAGESPVGADIPAGLLHRWSFNGDLTDSVGGQDAVHSGSSSYSWSENGESVSLPGGTYGTSGLFLGKDVVPSDGSPVTIEIWGTQREMQHQSRIFDLTSRPGEGHFGDFITMSWISDDSMEKDEIWVWEAESGSWTEASECANLLLRNALAPYELGTEYHISMVIEPDKDGAGNTYVRVAKRDAATGQLLAQTNGYVTGDWSPTRLSGRELWLGRSSFTPDNDASANYNEVRIWKAALTDEQLEESARRGPDVLLGNPIPGGEDSPSGNLSDGLVAYWPFDGNAKDASGNGNHGTVNGATLTADRNGNADSAYSFDGSNDGIVVAASESLRSPTNAISIAAWVNPDRTHASCVICKGVTRRQYGLIFSDEGDSYTINDRLGETNLNVTCRFSPKLETGVWTHFVATWDGKTCKAYANGVLVGEGTAEGVFVANDAALYIGVDHPETSEYYKGAMDDIAIWNRALSAEEVAQLYAGTSPANGN